MRSWVEESFEHGYAARRRRDQWVRALMGISVVLAAIPLASLGYELLLRGLPALDLAFFTETPKPVGEIGGGVFHAIIGSLLLLSLTAGIGIPWGIATGIYLSEYTPRSGHSGSGTVSSSVRGAVDLLSGVPSIVIGLFVYAVLVLPFKKFSALAGGAALGLLLIPSVARSTEELLKRVPQDLREAGLALGLPRWKTLLFLILPGIRPALASTTILGLARAAGETAPLLFTAFGSQYVSLNPLHPIASLPIQIFTYAVSPFDDWRTKAWGAALVLVLGVTALNLAIRSFFRERTAHEQQQQSRSR